MSGVYPSNFVATRGKVLFMGETNCFLLNSQFAAFYESFRAVAWCIVHFHGL